MSEAETGRIISFSRHLVTNPPDWQTNQTIIDCSIINLHSGAMETSKGN